MKCLHGLDDRFCAICRQSSPAVGVSFRAVVAGALGLEEILQFLNAEQIRATYGAVAGVLGVPARSVGAALGTRRPDASWVVNADTDLPTDYDPAQWHPALLGRAEVIRTANELTLRLSIWKARRSQLGRA